MELRNFSVFLSPVHWMNYFFSVLFLTEGLIGGGSKIPLLESIKVLAMSGKKIMWQASLVEFDILLKVSVIFFFEEVLLGSFWNIIREERATFVESGLIFADSSASWFLYINKEVTLILVIF